MDENKNQEMSVDELLAQLKASLQNTSEKKSAADVDDDDIKAAVKAAIDLTEDGAKRDAPAEDDVVTAARDEAEVADDPEAPATEEYTEDQAEDVLDEVVIPDASVFDDAENTYEEEAAAAKTVEVKIADVEKETDDEQAESIDVPAAESVETVEDTAEEKVIGSFKEDDILAAWGIDRADLPKKSETDADEEVIGEYVAPTAVKSKIYRISRVEKKTEFSLRKQTEAQKSSVDYDKTDYSLIKQALGMEKPKENGEMDYSVFEEVDNVSPKTIDEPHSEFTYQRQKDDIADDYKKMHRFSGLKLLFTAICAVLLFLVECLPMFGVDMPDAISFEYYPVVFVMAVMQFMWLCGAFSYKEIVNGVFSMIKFRFTSGSLLALLVFSCTVCDILICALKLDAYCYNFAAAFCALVIRIFDFLDIRREMLSFEIASSTQSKKYVAVAVENDSIDPIEGLEDYCGDGSLILRTEKCSFVENYFSRTEKRNESEIATNRFLVPVILATAVVSLIISIAKGNDAASVVTAFNLSLSVALPVLTLVSAAYPLYRAVNKLYRHESTIIGEKAVDEYSGTTMICFDDADAFPSYGVALENLRIYGKGDIETIIEQMGAIFSKLGGPLKHVFSLMTADCPRPYKVKIDGVYENGITAVVDGKLLFVGNARHMEDNGFSVVDKSDEIGGKRFSTMYLAQDGSLRAKFYIRYTLDGSFETIVKKLARRGIASVILTGDSNINDELLSRSLDIAKLPVKVVRRRGFDTTVVGDRADSGIVSRSGVGDLVSAVTMCDRLAGALGTMRALRIASVVICAFLMIGSCLLNMHSSISPLYVLLYHLFWFIPAWLVSKFNL